MIACITVFETAKMYLLLLPYSHPYHVSVCIKPIHGRAFPIGIQVFYNCIPLWGLFKKFLHSQSSTHKQDLNYSRQVICNAVIHYVYLS